MTDNPEIIFSPKATPFLVGHQNAVEVFLNSFNSNRLHHGWLISGPKGIGKATLAFHFARFLLKHGGGGGLFEGETKHQFTKDDFTLDPQDDIFKRVVSGAEGNIRVIKRGLDEKTLQKKTQIVIDDIRSLHDFFELTASHEGWRIAIIDTADEMNRAAANALLKMLEEPPKKTILLLITNSKGKLPATIRSRCQQLSLAPLKEAEVKEVLTRRFPDMDSEALNQYSAISGGSPGLSLRLWQLDGAKLFNIIRLVFEGGKLTTKEAHDFSGTMALSKNERAYFLFLDVLAREISVKIKDLAAGNAPKTLLDKWLNLWDKVDQIRTLGQAIHLGRKQMLLVLLEEMAAAGKETPKAA